MSNRSVNQSSWLYVRNFVATPILHRAIVCMPPQRRRGPNQVPICHRSPSYCVRNLGASERTLVWYLRYLHSKPLTDNYLDQVFHLTKWFNYRLVTLQDQVETPIKIDVFVVRPSVCLSVFPACSTLIPTPIYTIWTKYRNVFWGHEKTDDSNEKSENRK